MREHGVEIAEEGEDKDRQKPSRILSIFYLARLVDKIYVSLSRPNTAHADSEKDPSGVRGACIRQVRSNRSSTACEPRRSINHRFQ